MQSLQFVGIALHPTDPNIAYGGAQDNGTEKFNDSLSWPLVQGGDGGVIRIDPNNPNTVYHTFYYSGTGFLERSDNAGLNWTGKTANINLADPAYFYPPYVIDAGNPNRLLLGTNRVYETLNRADNWNPISAPNTNGWTSSAIIDAIGISKASADVIYASAGGKIFVSTNDGASWTDQSIPGVTDHFDDIVVDPTDPNIAYVVRDRFDGAGGTGHVWRTINGGASWTNLTGDLPDLPATSIELDVGAPGLPNDLVYVGNDDGVYWSVDQGPWKRLLTGLPRVQVRELEYQKNTGILAAATHGRGLWELSVPDKAKPILVNSNFTFATAPHQLSFKFSEAVGATLSVADLTLENLTTSTTVPSGNIALAYDVRSDTATFTFPGFTNGVLPDGRYRATLTSAGITDGAGNALAGPNTFDFFFLTGDANHDATVDLLDFNILAGNFGQSGRDFTQGNFNYDSTVDLLDFNLLAVRFGTGVGPELFSVTKIGAAAGKSRIIDALHDDVLA
jgi:photosystem II stability/assembly factor-like uncharacterized protein